MFWVAPIVLGLICFARAAASAVKLAVLLKGAVEIKKILSEVQPEREAPILNSSLVPPVAVIAAPPDASLGSRAFVKRLMELQAGTPK